MTHTLHREGIRKDSKDYVFLAMVEGNDPQKLDNLAELFKIILKHKPINYTGKALFPNLTDEQSPSFTSAPRSAWPYSTEGMRYWRP